MLLQKLKIDDPVDAAPVHGFCGIWGALATALFDWGKARGGAWGSMGCGHRALVIGFIYNLHCSWIIFLVLFIFTGGLQKTTFFATIPRVEMIQIPGT